MRVRVFSLIEMLVALSVLALVATAVLQQGSQTLFVERQTQQKRQALVIAESAMDQLRLQASRQPPAVWQERLVQGSVTWILQYEMASTAVEGLHAISVTVSTEQGDGRVRLDSYRGAGQ